jgi:hypothetical protein
VFVFSKIEIDVLDPRPKLPGIHISGLAICLYMANEEMVMVKGRKRRFITWLRTCSGGKRQSKHLAHLQPSLGYNCEL